MANFINTEENSTNFSIKTFLKFQKIFIENETIQLLFIKESKFENKFNFLLLEKISADL